MFGMWDVQNVECLGCGMFGMCDVCPVGCSRCGMFGLWDFLQNRFEKDFQTTVSSKIPLTQVLHNVFTIAGFI